MTRWACIPGCALMILASCGEKPVPPLADSAQWRDAHKVQQFEQSGKDLGRAQAEEVEKHLAENPDDLLGRQKLILFYAENGTRFYDPAFVVAARRKHILWLVEHHPELPVLGERAGLLNPPIEQIQDPKGYDEIKKAWIAAADKPDAPAMVLGNAAAFLSDTDKNLAIPLLQKAEWRDPSGPWSARQAALQANAQHHQPADGSVEALAAQAVSASEQDDWDAAKKAAQDALHQASGQQSDPDLGTAIYQANMVMGLLAMRDHDRKAAVKYMQDAANAPATIELQYFEQPVTYRLLSWLLKDGERETVIQFLQRFAKTSVISRKLLLDSADLIAKGQKPAWYPMEPQS